MYEPRQAPFGRADKAANWLLRARLYLNAEVYTGKADYANARDYADKVINSSYKLCPEYRLLFMADNDENAQAMQEIILPIRQDGIKTRNYGGSTYLVNGTRTAGMPRMGTTNGWSCIFSRAALVKNSSLIFLKCRCYPATLKCLQQEKLTRMKNRCFRCPIWHKNNRYDQSGRR